MNNNVLISWSINIITKLTLVFVAFILVYKIYIKLRSRFNIKVNCWFCNQNSKVPYSLKNCWTCQKCEQYNGFSKDGNYNREILEQYENNDSKHLQYGSMLDRSSSECFRSSSVIGVAATNNNNGFCKECNEAQRLKIEKLAQFEPERESRFEEELRAFKAKLEDKYRLCATCERHLKRVLHEKKRMILGSKLLHFVLKSAESIKQTTQSKSIKFVRQQQWKKRLSIIITLVTLLNAFCLSGALPAFLTHEKLISLFGLTVGHQLFYVTSHLTAAYNVLITYLEPISKNAFLEKIILFARTIFMMLLYSMGLNLPQITRLNFTSIYTTTAPFFVLCATLFYNLIDSFKVTRYIFLLILWSGYAGSVMDAEFFTTQKILMFLASLLTVLLTARTKREISPKLHDKHANSFHKMHSSDYLSDEDTISLISEQLNYSNKSLRNDSFGRKSSPSMRDFDANQTFCGVSPTFGNPSRNYNGFSLNRSPLTSSMLSLNLSSGPTDNLPRHSQNLLQRPMKSPFNSSMVSTFSSNKTIPLALFGDSSLDLNSNLSAAQQTQRAHSVLPTLGSSKANGVNNTFLLNNTYSPNSLCGKTSFSNRSLWENPISRVATPSFGNLPNATFSLHNDPHQQKSAYLRENMQSPAFGNSDQRTFIVNNNHSMATSPLHTSFQSLSNTAINHIEHPSNLLSPSRFSTASFNTVAPTNNVSWISSGYLNKTHVINHAYSCSSFGNYGSNRTFTKSQSSLLANPLDENLSRASSQSSGFESQSSGRVNQSRDNSHNSDLENESSELLQRTLTLEPAAPQSAFKPVNSTNINDSSVDTTAMLRRLPLNRTFDVPQQQQQQHQQQSLNINYEDLRLPDPPLSSVGSVSSFDTQRLHNQYRNSSSIRPGDLLRKWKESQTHIAGS